MKINVAQRDRQIVSKCAACRWLTTQQIQQLFFTGASLNAAQKRLRKLAEAGYLRSHRESRMTEAIYAVGPKGKRLVEDQGLEVLNRAEVPRQIAHLTGINTVRAALETSDVGLAYFIPYWELADLGWTFPVIPDAIFAISSPQRRLLLEFDRGTEPLKTLLEKMKAYAAGIPGFPFDAVLLITDRGRRLDLLAAQCREAQITISVLSGTYQQVQRKNFDFTELAASQE